MRAAIAVVGFLAAIALFVLGAPASAGPLQEGSFTLKVNVSGQGHVSSNPRGISCPGDCSASFPVESTVALSQSASSGWVFAGWGGDCSGGGGCKVTMTKNRSVNATFQKPSEPPPPPPPTPKFTLTVAVTGPGTVASTAAGIFCGTDCTQEYDQGTVVTLAPLTGSGARFVGWGGACTGTDLCKVTMDAAKSVTAKFLMQGARPPETRPLPGAGDIVNQVTVEHPYMLTMRFLCYSRSELFLTNLYRDVLGRAIDPVSLALLGPKLSAGMPPKEAALGVLQSLEYRSLLIGGFYTAFLHRAASPAELAAGLAQLVAGATDESLEAALLGSAEYLSSRGGGTNDGFLDALFQDLLGRAPTASERGTLRTAIENGTPRSQIATRILTSGEARTKVIKTYFTTFLNRAPTQAELDAYLASSAPGHRTRPSRRPSSDRPTTSPRTTSTTRKIDWGDGSSSPGRSTASASAARDGHAHLHRAGQPDDDVGVLAPDDGLTMLTGTAPPGSAPTAGRRPRPGGRTCRSRGSC